MMAAPARPAALHAGLTVSTRPTCRICLDEDAIDRLVAPCDCNGSQKFVHEACLEKWREKNVDSWKGESCMECHTRFHGVAPPRARQKRTRPTLVRVKTRPVFPGGRGGGDAAAAPRLRPGFVLTSARAGPTRGRARTAQRISGTPRTAGVI